MPLMTATPRRAAPLVLALLLLAAPAAAQRHEARVEDNRWTHATIDGSHRLEIRGNGRVEVNEDGNWVAGLSPAGRLVVEEEGRGPERRAVFTPAASGVRVSYSVDGRERALDAEGNAWLRRVLGEAVRESGLGAEDRVQRIRARRGVGGVLEEIECIRRDAGKRVYFRALFAGAPLGEDDFARAMRQVARIGSDVEKRMVLSGAAGAARGSTRLAALLDAAGTLDSDVEARLVLSTVAERHALEDGAARSAFFAGTDRLGSDVERRLVLARVLRQGTPARPTVVAALRSAGRMSSDVEKRLVLTQLPMQRLDDAEISRAYMDAVRTIGSEVERSLVLRRLAGRGR